MTDTFPPLKNDLIIRAAKGQKTERVPVWAMRQAGRYLPEFREVRKTADFFTMCQTPELACEVTLQPIRRFALDAAIIFSDILVIPQALGMEVVMKEGKGPVLPHPLVLPEDMKRLRSKPDVSKELHYVFKAITLTRHRLEGRVPLIGFSGAPWTLMAYMVEGEGSKTWHKSKRWLFCHPDAAHELLGTLADVIIEYLHHQVLAGAQLIQVFDSWAGELSPADFAEFCLPYLNRIGRALRERHPDIPLIVFAKGANMSLEALAKESPYDVCGLDWTIEPSTARQLVGPGMTLQGNLDPCTLYADEAVIRERVQRMLQGFGTQRVIANLGHGMQPTHSPDHLAYFVDAVHSISEAMNAPA